ncbi:MAG: hypothetical protein M1150_03855 [Patescibacteria group bacterium]|nr:hypothetical protein [Patescibacteria group bacterium]
MSAQTTFILIIATILVIIVAYLIGRLQGRKAENVGELPANFLTVYNELQSLPNKVLATIQGSINPQKGKVAELLTYAELRYDYDIIIPLGRPVDFIGIKNSETIDFIEVKSIQAHRRGYQGTQLTEEEKAIQHLIRTGKVNFRLVVVRDEAVRELFGEN